MTEETVKGTDGEDITKLLASSLQELYGDCLSIAVQQAEDLLWTGYQGDLDQFLTKFFHPAVQLLTRLKQIYYEKPCSRHSDWPLSCKGCVIVHLRELNGHPLSLGDFYVCVTQALSGEVHLMLKYLTNVGVEEFLILESEFGQLFTMDWINRLRINSDEDLGKLLHQCLVAMEDSIHRMRWEDVTSTGSDYHGKKSGNHCSVKSEITCGDKICSRRNTGLNYDSKNCLNHQDRESRAVSRQNSQGDTGPTRSPGYCKHTILDSPQTILDVNYDLLHSGISILPGCRDVHGGAVVFIFTSSSLWQNQQVPSTELARLLMYYQSVPREDVRARGLTLVSDIRGASSSTINILLETLYLFEGNIPGALSLVHFLCDKYTQSLVLKSPVYDTHAPFQLDLLSSQHLLYQFVDADNLPPVLDGYFSYCHDDWIRFHMKLDPFLSNCRAVAKYLLGVMQELSSQENLPTNAQEASHMIDHHEELVKTAFEDQRLVSLQSEGEAVVQCLRREEIHVGNSEDYRDSMDSVNKFYRQLQDTTVKLVRLADGRLAKLEQCLQLREFEEECTKIIAWLNNPGLEYLRKHRINADNLKAIRGQQKEFEKFYFSAMTHIEKGNDLLEEASMLAQSGNFDEVTGYKELARMLKTHLQKFTTHLEDTRERLESTTKCYHLLDKSYEWALEAMKYVASMKMEHCATPEGLEKLLMSLDLYLKEHPPVSQETFTNMIDLSERLQNDRLQEQCRVAKSRCEETSQLLNLRQTTLHRAKEQLRLEVRAKEQRTSASSESSQSLPDSFTDRLKSSDSEGAVWQPRNTSTPLAKGSHCSSRTACCGADVSPVHSQCSGFLSERTFKENGDDFITSDMSDRIVTSLPKILTDPRLRSSKEDLSEVGSRENTKSSGSSAYAPSQISDSNLSSHNRPMKKVLKRASTAPMPGMGLAVLEEDSVFSKPNGVPKGRQNGRTISMITGSTESLPSMPEEDEEEVDSENLGREYPKQEWTPVPVNSHLVGDSRNVPTGSLADLKLSEAEMRSRRTLALIMSEMIHTERDYVRSLQFVVDSYIPELQRDDVPQALRGKRNVVFGNIEKIYQFHRQFFLQEVEACQRNPFLLGNYFLMHENQFYLYALYNKNKPKSDQLMVEYGKHFFKHKQFELGDKMDLSSYLLKPVQRMGKYALLLKQIIKECPESEPEYHDLKAAEEMVKFHLRHGNDLLAMDSLKDCDVNLPEQGRLLRQNEFLVWQGRKKCLRHVFLFEDLVLFSKTKRGRHGSHDSYIYKHSFKMSDIGLTENYGETGYKFEVWFRRRSLGENYIFQAANSEVKNNWVRDISRLLWRQAIRNRENRLSEMATMGIGSKPCLDIKPSANNINDRYISIAVGDRSARTRNSIAVSSFDHLHQNNKRPHSVISVSSTSSSNSSHSSFGLFGSLNLAFDPLDSPHLHRQSVTYLSSESGIGTDLSSGDVDTAMKFDRRETTPSNPTTDYMKSKVLSNPNSYNDSAIPKSSHC